MRSRQVSLRRLRWRTTPGSVEPGASRLCAIACRAATLSSIGVQPSSAAAAGAALAAPAAGLITARIWLPSTASPTDSGANVATTPEQGAATEVSIFMALTTNSRSPAFTSAPSRALMSTIDPACGLSMASCPGGTGKGRAGGRAGAAAAPEARDLLVEELQRARFRLRGLDRLGEQRRPRVAGAELGMRQDRAQLVAVGRHADDVELVERAPRAVDGGVEAARGAGLADQLGQQRIELRRRRQPDIAAGIDAHAGAGRFAVGGERAGALRHDARLHGKAARRADRLLVGEAERRERRAGGDAELRLDQVEAHDLLGDGVLDLDARIALDEEVLAGLGIDQELDGAGILVLRRARELHGVGQDALAQAVVEIGRGRHLDDLLVAQLHRAVALEQVHDVALAVAQHLDLDVPRPRHDLLQEEGAIAERGLGFALAAREGLVHLLGPGHGAHAAPAAAGRGLQHHRIADGLGLRLGLVARGELRARRE